MANKQKDIIKDVKSALIEVLERVAKNGGLITYNELIRQVADNSQCKKEFADPVKGGRRRLVDYLDKINLDSANDKGVLLSVVVVGEHGMPDSGFFDKLRSRPQWELQRWRSASVMTAPLSDIFRKELSAVYEEHGAKQKIAVFLDMENFTTPTSRKNVLCALKSVRDSGGECVSIMPPFLFYKEGGTSAANWGVSILDEIISEFGESENCSAHRETGDQAADMRLAGVWETRVLEGGMFFVDVAGKKSRVVLTKRDIVLLFSDDTDYHNAVLLANQKEMRVWIFGDHDAKKGGSGTPINKFRSAAEVPYHIGSALTQEKLKFSLR